jgi:hypothetical protein
MDYRVICDRTGFKKWRSECRLEWDGKLVWTKVWRRRQPQDTQIVYPAAQPIPDARPETTDVFINAPIPNYD